MSSDEKPKYRRNQLPDVFEQAGLPRMELSTLHKLDCLGEGPPVAEYLGRFPLYDGDECIAWRKGRIAAQTVAAYEKQEANIKFRMKQLERMQRQAKAARESAVA